MADRLDPQERYDRVRAGINALLDLKNDDAKAVMDPRFWAKSGAGESALEGLREVARYYAEEHGAGVTFCVHCDDPIDDPEEAELEEHAACAGEGEGR